MEKVNILYNTNEPKLVVLTPNKQMYLGWIGFRDTVGPRVAPLWGLFLQREGTKVLLHGQKAFPFKRTMTVSFRKTLLYCSLQTPPPLGGCFHSFIVLPVPHRPIPPHVSVERELCLPDGAILEAFTPLTKGIQYLQSG